MIRTGRTAGDRGATAVEYALGLVLFVVVVMGGLQLIQRSAESTYRDDRVAVAATENLGTVAPTTSTPTTAPGPTTTSTSTTTTTDPGDLTPTTTIPRPVLGASCAGRRCTFLVSGAQPGATFRWVRAGGVQPETTNQLQWEPGNNGKVDYDVEVTVTPPASVHQASVTCAGGGKPCEVEVTTP